VITITVDSQQFQADFAAKLSVVRNPTAMLKAAGRELGNQLKKHFRARDETNVNRLAPERREHFWLAVAQSVQAPVQEGALSISVTILDPRLAQKIYGGAIVAKNARALTIPETEEAYGRTAATFEAETGLKLFLIKVGGTKSNALENAILAAKTGGGLMVEYVLTPSVVQEADPDALPEMGLLEAAILDRAQSVLNNQMRADARAAFEPPEED
jgi:hypothetical protein